jgi:DNA-binding LacI/PurR family transcriptional regulator
MILFEALRLCASTVTEVANLVLEQANRTRRFRMATMSDVAKRVGVSLSTVSYALNGTRPISEETRQRIFAAMEELGYKPHALARGLASKRSRIVALLFPSSERGLGLTELEFVTSAATAATEKGYHLVLWASDLYDPHELQELIQQGLVDGVIVMEVRMDDPRINWLRQTGFPFSMIGRCADTAGLAYADIDFEQTLRDTIAYLAGLGHTHIGYLEHSRSTFDAGYGPTVRSLTYFQQSVEAAGLTGISSFCPARPQAGYDAFNALLAECPDMTALIITTRNIIPGVMQAIAERGWRIPDDFSLVQTLVSARLAELTVPPLTTVEPPAAELGRLGVEFLIRLLEGHEHDVPQVLLPSCLVVRGSSGFARLRSQ